ncbi:MAG: 30S ribosomal protein S12 methylthiotransferase RimO [Bacteroidota bacterium]|nr:30S ribosomal protein S12 methylthiotransferase RimO [Bacteroidota bacterium]
MAKSVKIISLGCSKNTVDSEKLLMQLQHAGFNVHHHDNAGKTDIVIINTCGFIDDAKEESINVILDYTEARKRGDIGQLFVMGCLSERYKDELRKEIPEADQYFGVNKPAEILGFMESDYKTSVEPDRIITGPHHYAYLKVSEGCNRNCSYCAIPGIRGRYKSRPVEELLSEAQLLANKGVKEIILIAQDLSFYGIDLYRKPMLTTLCKEILKNDSIEWLRLHYLYPGSIPDDLLSLIKKNPAICKYIDIPIQHISDNVLSAMKRNHSEDETRKLLSHIRDYLPEAAIRTTLITGYPVETENDFNKLMDFIYEFRFERLGVFTYSHEVGTPAFRNYKDIITDEIKRKRADDIMSLQQEISLAKNLSLVRKEMRVIIDRKEVGYCIARSEYDSPEIDQEVLIKAGNSNPKQGDLCNVLITGATEFDLEAKLLP